jgi:hypothetical protein
MSNPLIEKYNELYPKKEIITRFNHLDNVLPKLERETIDGVRYYSIPDERPTTQVGLHYLSNQSF